MDTMVQYLLSKCSTFYIMKHEKEINVVLAADEIPLLFLQWANGLGKNVHHAR